MPMLVLSGEKAGGTRPIEQLKLVANDVKGQVVPMGRLKQRRRS